MILSTQCHLIKRGVICLWKNQGFKAHNVNHMMTGLRFDKSAIRLSRNSLATAFGVIRLEHSNSNCGGAMVSMIVN